jgi:hypothetical protein
MARRSIQVADKNVKQILKTTEETQKAVEDIMAAAKASTPDTSAPPAASATPVTVTVTAPVDPLRAEFDKLMAGLPDKNTDGSANLIKKLFKMSPLDINLLETVRESYKAAHPKGMLDAFKTAVQDAIIKAAAEYMVTLDGMEVLARFPQGEGTVLTVEVEACGRFTEKAEGKAPKGEGGKSGGTWGKVTVTDETGGLHYYSSLGDAKTRMGISTDWAADMFANFVKGGFTVDSRPATKDGSGVKMTSPKGWKQFDS